MAEILHIFNYMMITYREFDTRSWDKGHSAQHEMAIPKMDGFLRKYKSSYRKRAVKWLN